MQSNYNKNLKPLARNLRKQGTKAEALLWRDVLKAKQLWPYQFNRQFPIGNYIVDFIARKLKLIIEIDGSSHLAKSEEDFKKQEFLENQGYTILRFSEGLVVFRIDDVVKEIDYAIECIENQGNIIRNDELNTNPPESLPLETGTGSSPRGTKNCLP